ncbi:hypothetical protein QCA50_009245 [Cerrena zonata]|uniref:Tyrosine--tRNA ligase n=1 Tax=Cerrena zonata TaxID=2478898 RepID=A0AAW0G8A3_9APHY
MLRNTLVSRRILGRFPAYVKRWQSSTANKTSDSEDRPETITIVPKVEDLYLESAYKTDLDISLIGHLQSRYLVESITDDELFKLTEPSANKKLKLYCGADPTAKSLHLGNLLPLMVLLHFKLRGHDVVGLIGGATGAVGDPSGRTSERTQIENSERDNNIKAILGQITNFIEKGVEYANSRKYPINKEGDHSFENNASWWSSIKMLDFLATYGRFIRVSSMLGRDSIQSRLNSEAGLGFNEFTYQILQAYDFWHLYKNKGVNLQVGGNDQWGNIVAGVDLISRLQKHDQSDKEKKTGGYGMTVPLLTTPSGEKFDEIVEKLLKVFTLLPMSVIEQKVLVQHKSDPGLRIAQRVLAREVVDLIHGVGVGEEMAYITSFLFPTPNQPFDDEISADKLIEKFSRSGIMVDINLNEFPNANDLKMSTLLSAIFKKSKSETKNLIKAGGVYLGLDRDQFIDPEDVVLFDKENHLIDGKLLLARTGKQNYYIVRVY